MAAQKKQFSPASLILTLMVICATAGLALAAVNQLTAGPIRAAKAAEKLRAIAAVLPACANKPNTEARVAVLDAKTGDVREILTAAQAEARPVARNEILAYAYPGRDAEGRLVGWAIEGGDPQGYGGAVKLLVGLDPQGRVLKIRKLDLAETPGLGTKILKDKFLGPLVGKGAGDMKWEVKKDGGDVDAVTAATISSRAALRAIGRAFAVFEKLEAER